MSAATATKRATGGKGTSRAKQPRKAAAQYTPGEGRTLQEYAEHAKARAQDPTIPVDGNLLTQVKAIKPSYRLDSAERDALAQEKMAATPQAPKADKGKRGRRKGTGEPDARLAYPKPGKDGGARKGTRVAFHAVDGDPEGTLKFLGLYEFPTHTEAINKARKDHKLDDSALIVTLNARHAARSAPREGVPTPAEDEGAAVPAA